MRRMPTALGSSAGSRPAPRTRSHRRRPSSRTCATSATPRRGCSPWAARRCELEWTMKILITGGSGFLGSHIADAVSEAGHEAVVFDLKPSAWLRPGQQMVIGDVLDAEA